MGVDEKEVVLKSLRKFLILFELIGWLLLIAAIVDWFVVKMPATSIVLAIMSIVWIIGVRIDRKEICVKKTTSGG